jgi:hypothetical protein
VVFYGLSIVDEAKWNVVAVVVVVIGPFRCRLLFCSFRCQISGLRVMPFAPLINPSPDTAGSLLLWY